MTRIYKENVINEYKCKSCQKEFEEVNDFINHVIEEGCYLNLIEKDKEKYRKLNIVKERKEEEEELKMEDQISFQLSNGRHVKVHACVKEFPGSVKIKVAVGHERGNIIICSDTNSYYTDS